MNRKQEAALEKKIADFIARGEAVKAEALHYHQLGESVKWVEKQTAATEFFITDIVAEPSGEGKAINGGFSKMEILEVLNTLKTRSLLKLRELINE